VCSLKQSDHRTRGLATGYVHRTQVPFCDSLSVSYLHKPSTKLLPQLHCAHAKHCLCNQGKTVDSSRLLSLTFECCDDKAVLKDKQTSSCASSMLSTAGTPKQSVASSRVTKPRLQAQLGHISQLSVVMTRLFYQMNKHGVAHRLDGAEQESQISL